MKNDVIELATKFYSKRDLKALDTLATPTLRTINKSNASFSSKECL